MLLNGLVIIGVNQYWQDVAIGAVLVAAVYLDQFRRRLQRAGLRRRRLSSRPGGGSFPLEERCESDSNHNGGSLPWPPPALSACGSSRRRRRRQRQRKKTMELIVGTKSDDFYVTMECGARSGGEEARCLAQRHRPGHFSVPRAEAADRLGPGHQARRALVAPTDTAALDPDLLKVQKGGTKVIFVDTSSANSSIGLSRISSDNAAGGKLAADTLGKLIGGKGTVAVISVAKGVSTTDARIAGFEQEMEAKFPDIKLLPEQNDDADSVSTATSFIEGDISAHPDLVGAFAANVVTAAGRRVRHPARAQDRQDQAGHVRRRPAPDADDAGRHHPARHRPGARAWKAPTA